MAYEPNIKMNRAQFVGNITTSSSKYSRNSTPTYTRQQVCIFNKHPTYYKFKCEFTLIPMPDQFLI